MLLLSSIGAVAAADAADAPRKAPAPVVDVPFFSVNDNRLSYAYLPTATNPGGANAGRIEKHVFAFTHFDAWAYGTNFINLSYLRSNDLDPANPCPVVATGCTGRSDFFGQVRSTFGFNQIFDTRAFAFGALNNVSFEVGADLGTSNSYFASATNGFLAGVQFAFTLPYKGYINVAPVFFEAIDHNGFQQCGLVAPPCLTDGATRTDPTWRIETNYNMPLGFLPESLPLSISGYLTVTGPKGTQAAPLTVDRPSNAPTKVEILTEPIRLTLDASRMAWGPKYTHFLDVWVAYRYWQNKFGYDHVLSGSCTGRFSGSCTESSLYTGVTVKF
ncbi:hypothetical protein HNR60_004738 [Rhodopseudomonas rhenobacensis]|uniref:Uncharacterized protein n=2 Tax=Rhodopseudomonas rhenobacensis TaxID=87461 RepID=A0A7W8E1A0_9BRAD|nr:hypothetical protein [Rhodopseudomonas rhenobacensis]